MITRSRKAFTLLELMVAFIIMAILSAVAVPSLIGVVNGDQQTGNNASAIAIASAASDIAFAGGSTAAVTLTQVEAQTPAADSVVTGTLPGDVLFTIGTSTATVCVALPAAGATPTLVGTPAGTATGTAC